MSFTSPPPNPSEAAPAAGGAIVNGLSVDVEDYYQVQALARAYPRGEWDRCASRVERNTQAILEIFGQAGVKATFFTLGWIAERHPGVVRAIVQAGHELASHGYCHMRVDSQPPEDFRADVRRTRAILEDIGGVPVRGYRAATFSVGPHTPWAWPILEEEGYSYSSSVYPVNRDFYAFPDAPRTPYRPQGTQTLIEIPIATVRLRGRNWPCGGGGYFRLLPYGLTQAALSRINRHDHMPAVFYIHPWEVDPDQPRARGVSAKSRFRHYTNLSRTAARLGRLTRDFRWGRIDEIFLAAGGRNIPEKNRDAAA
ncbi:MAG TPA: XrtA system polysaccharide deacetylase [Rhizomicrobium sp.]|jgi:polysaccharide deacetylase family protein (PEP-CTERM system associated)|nr:XrtA system polysaccharide deacetylase [Rhizomicrobium sp.]